jgi:hypothetical protein
LKLKQIIRKTNSPIKLYNIDEAEKEPLSLKPYYDCEVIEIYANVELENICGVLVPHPFLEVYI